MKSLPTWASNPSKPGTITTAPLSSLRTSVGLAVLPPRAIKQVQGRIEGDNAVSKADGGDSITFSFNDSEGKKVDISDVHADVTVYDFGLYKTQTEAEEHTLATFTVDPTVDGSTATLALSDVAAHLPAKAADDDIQSLFIELHYTSNGDDAAMVTTAMIDDFTDYRPPAQ